MDPSDYEPVADSPLMPLTNLQLWTIIKAVDPLIRFRIEEDRQAHGILSDEDHTGPKRRSLVSWLVSLLTEEELADLRTYGALQQTAADPPDSAMT